MATSPEAEKKAKEIAQAFMRTEFDEEAEAMDWLVKRIAAALVEAEHLGKEAALLSMRRDRDR
jgi:hypothetical protein